jgi:endo-1,4-beta-xylanase
MRKSIAILAAACATIVVSCATREPAVAAPPAVAAAPAAPAPSAPAPAAPAPAAPAPQKGKDVPSLKELYAKNFKIGTCVELDQLQGPESELLLRHYSSVTAENLMKPKFMAPEAGKYFFDDADRLVEYALAHGLAIRGHTLVWHQQNAAWMFKDDKGQSASKEVLLQRLKDYIFSVVGRYKGKIYAWDVVNEVVNVSGLRRSDWTDIAGEEFIEKAFAWAHEADPGALLFINDIDTAEKVKRDTLYALIKKLLDKGVPVQGIGLQYHITMEYPSLQEMKDELDKFSSLGLPIHVTELDMSLNDDPKLVADQAPEDKLIRQAYRYKEIFDLFKQYKSVESVTFWGMEDGRSWLTYSPVQKPDWPLLFDKDLNPKPAYWALVDPSRLPPDVFIKKKTNNKIGYAGRGTPVVDGEKDEAWNRAEGMPIEIFLQGKGSTGVGRAMWDDKNLYVLVEVKEATLSNKSKNAYEHDSVEIFVDEKNNKSKSYEEDDAQYRLDYENQFSFRGYPAQFASAAKVTEGGYIVEIAIPFRFVKPEPGIALGFDLQVNDDDGSGNRTSFAKWNDPTNESFRNTSGFGKLLLIE